MFDDSFKRLIVPLLTTLKNEDKENWIDDKLVGK
jgi:hypothetical protein